MIVDVSIAPTGEYADEGDIFGPSCGTSCQNLVVSCVIVLTAIGSRVP